jgi:hypothetical protein
VRLGITQPLKKVIMLSNYKRITSVRKAKKHLKTEKHWCHVTQTEYTMVKWDKKMKSFLVQSRSGQRSRIFEIFVNHGQYKK